MLAAVTDVIKKGLNLGHPDAKAKINWLGHASIQVEAGGNVIFFDPCIEDNPVCSVKSEEIKRAEAVCVTHGHIDHIGDSLEIVNRTGAPSSVVLRSGSMPKNTGSSMTKTRSLSLLTPKFFIPIHYDTFPNQGANLDRLNEEIKTRETPVPSSRLHLVFKGMEGTFSVDFARFFPFNTESVRGEPDPKPKA